MSASVGDGDGSPLLEITLVVPGGEIAVIGGELMTILLPCEPFVQLLFSTSSVLVQFKPRFWPV